MSSRYTNPTILNSGIGYTLAEIEAALPETVEWEGDVNLTWDNITVNSAGQLTGLRLYHGNLYKGGGSWDSSYAYSTRNLSLPPAGTAVSDAESYGSALVVSGKSVNGNTQNAQGADAINIAKGLANQTIPANSLVSRSVPATITDAFTIQRMGTTIAYTRKDGSSTFGFTVSDGLGGSGLGKVYKEVSSISDLPTVATDFFKVKVAGDIDIDQDDYYVEFSTGDGSGFGDGTWSESAGPNVKQGLDNTTMPMKLVSDGMDTDGVDNFTLSTVDYDERKAGDDDSNPAPSFVNAKIENMFYYKDRLGFLSRENIILSEVGQPFSFYRTSVTSLLDSDVIDVAAASGGVTKLTAAVGFQDNLILFSENGQFALKGGDILTPRTVSINPITNFGYSESINPMLLGSLIYYPFTRGTYSGLREFTVNSSTDVFDSQEVTEHVPAYLPSNILDMAGTTSENIIALVSSDEPSCIYIYNYFWNNQQKVLSAWSKFTIAGEIRGMEFIDSDLFLVVASEGKTQLLNMPLNSGQVSADAFVSESSVDFGKLNVLLDERIEVRRLATTDKLEVKKADGAWSSAAADFPYSPSDATKYKFVTAAGETHVVGYNANGFFLNDAGITPFYQINIYGYLGRTYDMEYKFSTQLFKASSGKSASPSAASAMTIRNGAVFFDETSEFTVKVTPEGRPMASNVFLASSRPDADTYNGVKFSEGFFRFPVHSKAKHANITLQNSSPFDCKFSSAEFESFVHPRSNRYG